MAMNSGPNIVLSFFMDDVLFLLLDLTIPSSFESFGSRESSAEVANLLVVFFSLCLPLGCNSGLFVNWR